MMKALELFSGPGLMGLAAERAGFRVKAAVEFMPRTARTYAMNHPRAAVLNANLRAVAPGALARAVGPVDLVFGGPPCEGFSSLSALMGREAPRQRGRGLYVRAMRIVAAARPRGFVFENIPSARLTRAFPLVLGLAKQLGYSTFHGVFNATDFGAPQRRKRLFLFGIGGKNEVKGPMTRSRPKTARDAIDDLGSPFGCDCRDTLHHMAVPASPLQRRMLARIKPGEIVRDRAGKYGSITQYLLAPDLPANTIIASVSHFHWDLRNPRTLSLRETARLQGFPDSYKFCGTRTEIQHQIGDAVPRWLGLAMLRHAKLLLRGATRPVAKGGIDWDALEAEELRDDWIEKAEAEELGIDAPEGTHPHPHAPNGQHEHDGLPPGGGHAHFQSDPAEGGDAFPLALGAHRHRPDDPIEGVHVGMVGDGRHDHPEALGRPPKLPMEELVRLHRERPWLPGFVRALIRERASPGEPFGRWQEWTDLDGKAHALHPTHHVTPAFDLDEHAKLFLGPERLIDKLYEFGGGVVRPVKEADFEAEGKWFGKDSALPSGPVRASPQSSARTKQRTGSFILQRRHWRVREVVREGPSVQFWHVRFDWGGRFAPALLLSGDPAKARSTTGTYDPRAPRAMLGRVGTFPTVQIDEPKPKEVGSVTVEEQDRGKAEMVEEGEGRIVVRLAGRILSGEFAVRDEGGGVWSFSRTEKFRKFVPIVHVEEKAVTKRDGTKEDRRLVYGIVYEPFKIDAQGDWATPETIEAAAHRFLADSRQIKLMHRHNTDKIVPVESYIAPQDFSLGRKHVAKGSWIMVSKVLDPALWARIKAGEFRGYSLGGRSSVADAAPPVAA